MSHEGYSKLLRKSTKCAFIFKNQILVGRHGHLSLVSSKLNLIPFQTVVDGQVVLCSDRQPVIHYILVALPVAMVIWHVVVSISYLGARRFDLNTYMSLCFLM